jgi:RNA polymerase sigma factor (sigma-70 family)
MNVLQPGSDASTPADAEQQQRLARVELVERLFHEHNEALIRFLRTRLRSQQEAREIAQEAYVRLLSLDEPGAVSYLRAFLFKTAANLAVDRMRRDELQLRTSALPLFQELSDARTPERQVAGMQMMQRLERLIAAMPAKCRQAFMLRRFDGRDVGSIANELNLSKRMVREYVARALLQCRVSLDLEQTSASEADHDTDD